MSILFIVKSAKNSDKKVVMKIEQCLNETLIQWHVYVYLVFIDRAPFSSTSAQKKEKAPTFENHVISESSKSVPFNDNLEVHVKFQTRRRNKQAPRAHYRGAT